MGPPCGITPGDGQVLRRSDRDDGGRPLTEEERAASLRALLAREVAPAPLCRRAVEGTRLHPWPARWRAVRGPRTLVAQIALRARADGITLGRRVYIRAALFDRPTGLSRSLVAHEVCHVAQILREGVPRFYARYVTEYARGLARGLGDRAAYLAISYEVEARAVGRAVGAPRA